MYRSTKTDPQNSNQYVEKASQKPDQALSDTVKAPRQQRLAEPMANQFRSPTEKSDRLGTPPLPEGGVVTVHSHAAVKPLRPASPPLMKVLEVPGQTIAELQGVLGTRRSSGDGKLVEVSQALQDKLALYSQEKVKEYDDLRRQGTFHEHSLGFDAACTQNAKPIEIEADRVFQQLKRSDAARVYDKAPKRRGHLGQEHARFCGDHFLSNADLIEQTQLFSLFRAMPKGAHLHIHFNANLLPSVLLGIAKGMKRMFVWSNIPLDRKEAFGLSRIQFSIMNEEAVKEKGTGNPFTSNYQGNSVMQFQEFREAFPGGEKAADSWLESKLVFQEEEAYNLLQTADG